MIHPPTQTEIRAMLADAGLRPDKRYGQHFLVDGNLMRMLVAEAELTATDTVLEVGPGVGNLTRLLVAEAGHVVAAEVDAKMAEIAREQTAGAANLDLVVIDILAGKHVVEPRVMDLVRQWQTKLGGLVKLVANLPYAAATPLVAELVQLDSPPERLVFTVQEEVAERFMAAPGTREYGPVGVLVQGVAEVEILRRLGTRVFWPPPKVGSAMVRIRPSVARRGRITDVRGFRRTIEGLFMHRRKRAARSLSLADPAGASPQEWAARLAAVGLDPEARGETYTVEGIIALANAIAADHRTDT